MFKINYDIKKQTLKQLTSKYNDLNNKLLIVINEINIRKYGNIDFNIVVKIQSLARGFIVRLRNFKLKDSFQYDDINDLLNAHISLNLIYIQKNLKLNNKKIRMNNFPSEISENIAKLAIRNKYNICPKWDVKGGDMMLLNKYLEIKAFSSLGPTSFGPSESWFWIYFVDCLDYLNKNFIVYEIRLSNTSIEFQNIMFNSTETYFDQCNQKRRPRIGFKKLLDQIDTIHYSIIFNGHISELN